MKRESPDVGFRKDRSMDATIGFLKMMFGLVVAALSVIIILGCIANVFFWLAMLFGHGIAVGEKTFTDMILSISIVATACLIVWAFISVYRAGVEWLRDGWSTIRGDWKPFVEEEAQRAIDDFRNRAQ